MRTFLFIVSFSLSLSLILTCSWIWTSACQDAVTEELGIFNGVQEEPLPTLLWWDPMSGLKSRMTTCDDVECVVSSDRSLLHTELIMILFYGTLFAETGLPLPRKPKHIWAVIHEESPKNNMYLFEQPFIAELFNYSSTYKRQSHLPVPTMWLHDPGEITDMEYFVPLAEKNRLRQNGLAPIVFVHSDCSTLSDRSHYIQIMMKHINVDSYGACENNKQLPDSIRFSDSMSGMSSTAYYKVLAQYKFAMAFENAVCDDYITEKFWRPFHLGVVPIVFGSPKIKDFLPASNSAVIITDFHSVKDLVNYINFLDNNDTAYGQYLAYKRSGISNPMLINELRRRDWGVNKYYTDIFDSFQCHMCHKLHRMRKLMKEKKPLPVSKAKSDHFSCPPIKTFNNKGQYVDDRSIFLGDRDFSKYYAMSIKYYVDKGVNVTTNEVFMYASSLERKFSRNDLRKI